jgi:hypothetical protein
MLKFAAGGGAGGGATSAAATADVATGMERKNMTMMAAT